MTKQKSTNWGGRRTPGPGKTLGPDRLPEEQKRKYTGFVLDRRTKPLATELAEILGLKASGYLVDQLIAEKAAKMGYAAKNGNGFLPCPFCGSDEIADEVINEWDEDQILLTIRCTQCGASNGAFGSKGEAQTCWNTRK